MKIALRVFLTACCVALLAGAIALVHLNPVVAIYILVAVFIALILFLIYRAIDVFMNEEPDEYAVNAAFIAAVANALPRLLTLAEAGLRAEEMREALQELLPPEYGVSGGPFVGAKCIYEDGSDENTARHRGWISHEAVARARKALEPSHG